MKRIALVGAVITALGLIGCEGAQGERIAFDGQYFSARLSGTRAEPENFEIIVHPASAGVQGARLAGVYEANSYCITRYGSSQIVWAQGPDLEDTALINEQDDTLVLIGTCAPL